MLPPCSRKKHGSPLLHAFCGGEEIRASIHALVKGTDLLHAFCGGEEIRASIHALVKGTDLLSSTLFVEERAGRGGKNYRVDKIITA